MSGQQIGSVVGGVIGAYFGGPYGYAIGSAIGGAIGGYVDPTVIKGPKLTDATQQTASDGVPIPWGHGTFPTSGNIIWCSTLRERKKEDDGKGTGIVNVTYHYYRDFAIGICSGVRQADGTYLPIEGILQITENGKVVYDVQPGASSEQAAQNSKFMRNTRFYLGSETQDPDSVIESHKGVGNAPAYPGMVYMVRENLELTESGGAIPQYGFVVSICGDVIVNPGTSSTEWLSFQSEASVVPSPDGYGWDDPGYNVPAVTNVPGITVLRNPEGSILWQNGAGVAISFDDGLTFTGAVVSQDVTGHVCAYSGDYWHLCDNAKVGRLTDALAYSEVATAPELGWVVLHGGDLIGIGNPANQAAFYSAEASGDVWTHDQTIASSTITVLTLTGGDSSEFECGFIYNGEPSGFITPQFYVSAGADFQAGLNPFGSFTFSTIYGGERPILKWFDGIKMWVATSYNRMAYGPSLSTLNESGYLFPDTIAGVDYDGFKFIFAGRFGYRITDDLESFTTPSPTTATEVYAILSLANAATPIPDAPGWAIDADGQIIGPSYETLDRCKPTLGEIVLDACLRSGLSADDVDVSQLTDEVDGFKVATETTAEAIIAPLMQGFFFDAAEFDDKIRFIKRGGDVVGELTYDDLCESDGDVIEETELQEAELLQKVNVRTIDPAAGFTVTTQTAERRTSTVLAKGEQTTEIPVVTDKDTQARMADKKLKVGWSETRRFKTCIPYTKPQYTPTDNIGLTDNRGRRQRVRIMEMAEDSGRIEIREAMLSRQSSYTSDVEGVTHAPPTDTTPGLVGPTFGVAMNLPSLRTSDNVAGAYLAACGYLRGWGGCAVLLSVDGGVSYQEVTRFAEPSTMGVLHEACTASSEPIRVFMNSGALSSITEAQLALRMNAFAITTGGTSELGQFQTATLDSGGIYDLTDTVRGALGTTATSHPAGDPFVMVASAKFVPLDISLAGRTLYFKFVSFGTSADDTAPYPFVFNPLFTSISVSAITVGGANLTVEESPIYVVTQNA